MTTGIFVTARVGSTRLPQKHLIDAHKRTFIAWLVGRYVHGFRHEISRGEVKVVIVTSTEQGNEKFRELFARENISVFFGDNDNIPLRHLQCALNLDISHIVSIDGDDILCSVEGAALVREQLLKGVAMAKTEGLPLGMNVMGYSTKFLRTSLSHVNSKVLETGWGRIFDASKIKNIELNKFPESDALRMTLDYEVDAEFFKTVISGIGDRILQISDEELVKYIVEHKLYLLNKEVNEEYWANFRRQQQKED
jgi:spore coat polysaccharide biosynthesis protein SpsF (cytidylyltransferase family)